jgi:beta-phosphoglucomutase-like phosphatase (HAD superfamily)
VEVQLDQVLSVPKEKILPGFGGDVFDTFLMGGLSEDEYLESIISREGWTIGLSSLKAIIRANFHNRVDGSLEIVRGLLPRFDIVLHSDHAKEWIAYIKSIHPFMEVFKHKFFSYDLKVIKSESDSFLKVLDHLAHPPQDCLFVDDNPINIQAAQATGLGGIHFLNTGQLKREFENREIL